VAEKPLRPKRSHRKSPGPGTRSGDAAGLVEAGDTLAVSAVAGESEARASSPVTGPGRDLGDNDVGGGEGGGGRDDGSGGDAGRGSPAVGRDIFLQIHDNDGPPTPRENDAGDVEMGTAGAPPGVAQGEARRKRRGNGAAEDDGDEPASYLSSLQSSPGDEPPIPRVSSAEEVKELQERHISALAAAAAAAAAAPPSPAVAASVVDDDDDDDDESGYGDGDADADADMGDAA
jgi:hypothetical protein